MVRNRCQNENPSTSAVSKSFGSTWRIAEKVFRYSGKLTPSATSSTLGSSPMPNQRMNNGIRPRCGNARSICIGGSTEASTQRDKPTAIPNATPRKPPSSNTLDHPPSGYPERVGELAVPTSSTPASAISDGAGSTSAG